MGLLLFILLLGLIPAAIARGKGRSFFGWWIYGAALFLIALPHAILIEAKGMTTCPHCAERVKGEASVCRYCGRALALTDAEQRAVRDRINQTIQARHNRFVTDIKAFLLWGTILVIVLVALAKLWDLYR